MKSKLINKLANSSLAKQVIAFSSNHILDKVMLIKVILFDFLIRKNWFINIILVITLILIQKSNTLFFGPFLGAFLTFNLVSGYSYYQKKKSWQMTKKTIAINIYDFIYLCSIYLQCHQFPIIHKKEREHFDIDNIRDQKMMLEIFSKGDKEKKRIVMSVYEMYGKFLRTIQDNDIKEINIDRLEKMIFFLDKNEIKIISDLYLVSGTINESNNLLSKIQVLCFQMNKIKDYYENGIYKENRKFFIEDICKIIDSVIIINKML